MKSKKKSEETRDNMAFWNIFAAFIVNWTPFVGVKKQKTGRKVSLCKEKNQICLAVCDFLCTFAIRNGDYLVAHARKSLAIFVNKVKMKTETESLKQRTAKGLMWGGLSNGMVQLLGAVFGLALLRLLTPADYGKVAVLLVFANIASTLQESGFTAALANKKEPTHADYNAVFWFNILVSAALYVILFLCAPLIADFYHEPKLTLLARVLFIGFFISSLGTVQRAYLFGHLMVKQTSIIAVTSLIVSGLAGVGVAWWLHDPNAPEGQSSAYWGLVVQNVGFIAVVALMNWWYSPWQPTFNINLKPAWGMFGFSSKLLLTNLFNNLNSHAFSVLLGHYYGDVQAGIYNNARKWDDMCCNTINGMVTGVAQPVLAQVRDDEERYRAVFRKMLRFISFVSFPAMLGMGIIAREFILLAVGDQWEESATLLSMLCVYGAFFPITTLYSHMAISRGKSGINMFCIICLCPIIWIGLILLNPVGVKWMVVFFVAVNVLWLFVWQWFAWRLFRLSYWHALKDVSPFLLLALAVMGTTWFVAGEIISLTGLEGKVAIIVSLIIKVVMAAVLYLGLVWMTGAKIMRESIDFLRKKK